MRDIQEHVQRGRVEIKVTRLIGTLVAAFVVVDVGSVHHLVASGGGVRAGTSQSSVHGDGGSDGICISNPCRKIEKI